MFDVVSLDEPRKIEEPSFFTEMCSIEQKVEQPELKQPEKVEVPIVHLPAMEVKVEETKPIVEEKPKSEKI